VGDKMKTGFIKWTGSKRSIAKKIVDFFPKQVDTYYEPFIGGGSVFFELLKSECKIDSFVISDKNTTLIEIYELVKNNPYSLINSYCENWSKLQSDPNYFYEVRELYNKNKCPLLFYFLTRTCYNGTIRYNKKGEFNTSHHFGRKGMATDMVKKIILYHNDLMKNKNIKFVSCSFETILPKSEKDVIYLDPPYTNTKMLYFGNIDFDQFKNWVSSLKCSWFLNLNGVNKMDNEEVLDILFDEKVLISSGNSSFSRMKGNNVKVGEYFYYKKQGETQ